jgi:Flagellar L-ring protein
LKETVLKKIFCAAFFLLSIFLIDSKSIWDDRAGDIYSRKVFFREGDSIQIVVSESSALDYKSASKSLKNFKVDVKGGEASGILSFLPAGSIEEAKSGNDNDKLNIKTVISARVESVNPNSVLIRGIKQITVNNKSSYIEIAGEASVKDINGGSILSSKLMNQTLRITTLIDNQNNVITARDLETKVTNPDSTTDRKEEIKLSDAKKRDLLLKYFNKLLNLVF